MDWKYGEGMERISQYCCNKRKSGTTFSLEHQDYRLRLRHSFSDTDQSLDHYLPPPKMNQSCSEVAIKSTIGSDNQAFVREAMNACRASSGAAGGPPCKAPMRRLFAGQIIPQTFSSMIRPSAPPTPIERELLAARCFVSTIRLESIHFTMANPIATTKISATMAKTRPSLIKAGTFLMIRNSIKNVTIGMNSQTISNTHPFTWPPAAFAL